MFNFFRRKKEYPIDSNDQYKEVENNFLASVTSEYIQTKLPHVYQAMEDHFYQTFDFSKLYQPSAGKGLIEEFGSYITIGLLVLILVKSFF